MMIPGLPLGLQLQGLEFADFSGGMTDNYVNALLNQYERGDNLLITASKQLQSRPGSKVIDPVNNRPAANRIGRIFNYVYDGTLLYQSAQSFYSGTLLTPLNGPSGNQLLPQASVFDQLSYGYWNGFVAVADSALDRPIKIYKDPSGTLQARTAGLPLLTGTPTATLQAGNVWTTGTQHRYLYRFHYRWQCQVGAVGPVTFSNFGPTSEIAVVTQHPIDGTTANGITINHNSTLNNGTNLNYELTGSGRVQVWIYRSSDGGTTFNRVHTQNHDDASAFVDTIPDDAYAPSITPAYTGVLLSAGQLLYTTGGVQDSFPPPRCKFAHVCLNRAYYGYVQYDSDNSIQSNIVYQSLDGQIDAVPLLNFVELEEEVTGISSVLGRPIVLCKQKVYRLEGEMDESSQGQIQPVRISDIAGCVSAQSIVQTQEGIFWAGNDGFYFSDGYGVKKISEHLNDTYSAILAIHPERIQGSYDPKNRRIWWTIQGNSTSPDCDSALVLDLKFGVTPQSPFTSISGGASFSPSSFFFYNNNLLRGDHRGYILKHDDALTNDPVILTSSPTSQWVTQAIIYDYIGPATNFGTSQIRKWVPRLIVDCKNLTNLSLQVISINDDGRQNNPLAPLRYRGNITWGDPEVVWGDPTIVWNVSGLIEKKLNFPGRALRCSFKQVELTNASVIITNSDTFGPVSVNPNLGASNGTATLNTSGTSWPSDPTGQYLTFQYDNYALSYLITGKTDTTLTYADPNKTSVAGSVIAWEIAGIPKDEQFKLLSYTLHYAFLTDTQTGFASSDLGGNK